MATDLVRPHFEVADVVRTHIDELRAAHPLSVAQEKVLRHITSCRTAALGGHVDECDACGHTRISYNSCRDRHCPKCQAPAQAEWLEQRLQRLLPIPYFHVVFTIPEELNPLALRNKEAVFQILFHSAAATLQTIARDPRHLGAEIGVTAVLHTWGQKLLFHPHVHCVVTGAGLSADHTRWIRGREDYFLPVDVLGKLFRGKFLSALQQAYADHSLRFAGSTAGLDDAFVWAALKDALYRKDWIVYAKRPFGGPEQVFRYLGRYTHRIAISNHRIVDFQHGKVTFSIKDYADRSKRKNITLDAVEFLRRFVLHVLPARFVRIRHYGLHAGKHADAKLEIARRVLLPQVTAPAIDAQRENQQPLWWERFLARTGVDVMQCPACRVGRLIRKDVVTPPTTLRAYTIVEVALARPP